MTHRLRFKPNTDKLVETLCWIANEQPGISFSHVCKVLYFADKQSLVKYGRPVTGDTYIRMEHGPVGTIAYDLLKLSDFLDGDIRSAVEKAIEAGSGSGTPALHPRAGRLPDIDYFSRTDLECLRASLSAYGSMPFPQLRAETHKERAWLEADENSSMDLLLMIDGDDLRIEVAEQIAESAAITEL